MANEVKQLGNGLVFDEYTPATVAKCIAQAQGEIVERCVDAIESFFHSEQY